MRAVLTVGMVSVTVRVALSPLMTVSSVWVVSRWIVNCTAQICLHVVRRHSKSGQEQIPATGSTRYRSADDSDGTYQCLPAGLRLCRCAITKPRCSRPSTSRTPDGPYHL